MSAIPSLSLPISIARPTCQSSCNCCSRNTHTEQLSARLYADGDQMKAIKRPWWSYIFCCCWQEPAPEQKRSGVLRYRAHLYKIHGKSTVRMAYGVADVDLDEKVERRKSLSLREIIRLEHTIAAMKKFDLRYHRGEQFTRHSAEDAEDGSTASDSDPPLAHKKSEKL